MAEEAAERAAEEAERAAELQGEIDLLHEERSQLEEDLQESALLRRDLHSHLRVRLGGKPECMQLRVLAH